jgi:hypothetical protein
MFIRLQKKHNGNCVLGWCATNCGWNVGENCRHTINTGGTAACKGWIYVPIYIMNFPKTQAQI